MHTRSIPLPCIALITDRSVCGGANALIERVAEAVDGGVTMVQLREKDLSAEVLLRLGERLRRKTEGKALLIVNGDVHLALAIGADGIQLPEASLSAGDARRLAGDRPMLVGRSVHDTPGAAAAVENGADFVLAGAVFETLTHPGQPPAGLKLVQEIRRSVAAPLIAVGGITADNAASVIDAGADGVAVIREVLVAPDVRASAARLRAAVERTWAQRAGTRPAQVEGLR